MLSLATPAALLGLLLVPVIRWLHRGGPLRDSLPVASLALWQRARSPSVEGGWRRPPDPAWRRRALLAAVLVATLAAPQWSAPTRGLTLWVDDSPSMLTREDGRSRLERGLALAAAELSTRPGTRLEVRTLGQPWNVQHDLAAGTRARLLREAGRHATRAPPPGLLDASREHWLLSDGAQDASVPAGITRLLQVGRATRNVGLVRLAARRRLGEPQRLDVLLELRNGGAVAERRSVVLQGAAGELARRSVTLAPGAVLSWTVATPAEARFSARLEPGDALPLDDTLMLDAQVLRTRRVQVDPGCPLALRGALAAHPALSAGNPRSGGVELVVDCGGEPGGESDGRAVPRLRFVRDARPEDVLEPLLWSQRVADDWRGLGAYPWRRAGRLAVPPDGTVTLLAAGDVPLLQRREVAGAALLESVLDVEARGDDDPAAVPMLLAFMVDEVLSATLLEAVAAHGRPSAEVRVAPRIAGRPAGTAQPAEVAARERRELSRPLLVLALLLCLWELALLARGLARRRRGRVSSA